MLLQLAPLVPQGTHVFVCCAGVMHAQRPRGHVFMCTTQQLVSPLGNVLKARDLLRPIAKKKVLLPERQNGLGVHRREHNV